MPVTDLMPLGVRRLGAYVEPMMQAVLVTQDGGLSQPFYVGRESVSNSKNTQRTLGRLKDEMRTCQGPTHVKGLKLFGQAILDAATECSVLGTDYRLDNKGAPALRLSREELAGSLGAIVEKYFTAA